MGRPAFVPVRVKQIPCGDDNKKGKKRKQILCVGWPAGKAHHSLKICAQVLVIRRSARDATGRPELAARKNRSSFHLPGKSTLSAIHPGLRPAGRQRW